MPSGQMDPTNTRLVYQRALQDPEVTAEMAINALAFWAFLDTKYPHCEFQSTMLRRSEDGVPMFSVFFREAERTVQKLQNPKDSELEPQVINSLLFTTRMVLVNKDFQLVPLFANKEDTRAGFLSFVTICQNHLQPGPHQEAQEDDVGNQEEGIGDESERTLEINFTIKDPVPEADIHEYMTREFGHCIQDIFMCHPTASIVLQKQQDVTRVMGGTDIKCRKVTIKGMAMWISKKEKVGEAENQ